MLGARLPGTKSSSSSRGKKPRPAGGADRVAPLQPNRLLMLDRQIPRLHLAPFEPRATLRARRGIPIRAREVRCGRRKCRVLQHPRPYLGQPLVQRRLDLPKCRLRVLDPPLLHPAIDFFGLLPPPRLAALRPHTLASLSTDRGLTLSSPLARLHSHS